MADWYTCSFNITEGSSAARAEAHRLLTEWDSDFPFRNSAFFGLPTHRCRWRSPPSDAAEFIAKTMSDLGISGHFFLAPDRDDPVFGYYPNLYKYVFGGDQPYDTEVLQARQRVDAERVERAVDRYLAYCRIFCADPLNPTTLTSTDLWTMCSEGPGLGGLTQMVYLSDGVGSSEEVVDLYRRIGKLRYEDFPSVVSAAQVRAEVERQVQLILERQAQLTQKT